MEPHLGYDLRNVRVHGDAVAARSAQALGAAAYTLGSHIVLGRGSPAPETPGGRRLVGHELAHVVQQFRAPGEGRIQRQLITPQAVGGGFGGLLDRDWREAFRPRTAEEIRKAQEEFAQMQREARQAQLRRRRDQGSDYGFTLASAIDTIRNNNAQPDPINWGLVSEDRRRFIEWSEGKPEGRWHLRLPPISISDPQELEAFVEGLNDGLAAFAEMERIRGPGRRGAAGDCHGARRHRDDAVGCGARRPAPAGARAAERRRTRGRTVASRAGPGVAGARPGVAGARPGTAAVARARAGCGGRREAGRRRRSASAGRRAASTPATAPKERPVKLVHSQPASAVKPEPVKVPVPAPLPVQTPSSEPKRRSRPPFVLRLPLEKEPHFPIYSALVRDRALVSEFPFSRGRTNQVKIWDDNLAPGGANGMSLRTFERGKALGLDVRDILRPRWTHLNGVGTDVDHVIELQVTPLAMRGSTTPSELRAPRRVVQSPCRAAAGRQHRRGAGQASRLRSRGRHRHFDVRSGGARRRLEGRALDLGGDPERRAPRRLRGQKVNSVRRSVGPTQPGNLVEAALHLVCDHREPGRETRGDDGPHGRVVEVFDDLPVGTARWRSHVETEIVAGAVVGEGDPAVLHHTADTGPAGLTL